MIKPTKIDIMKEILNLLKLLETTVTKDKHPFSVTLYSDSSGVIKDQNDKEIFQFGRNDFHKQFYNYMMNIGC